MDKFYIITNHSKDGNLAVTKRIEEYLTSNGKTCMIQDKDSAAMSAAYRYTNAELIPEDVECILVLGGDGTLLQAARDVVNKQIPLLGINLGTLGYLAEIDQSSIKPALDHLMLDEYEIEERMMIEGTVYHNNKKVASDLALNDIVIRREGPLRVVKFRNFVNEEFLNSYNADGIIVATPTGSTGYSLSAGGPIVSPTAALLLMTPIAPHTLNTRSILFDDKDRITVEIGPGRGESPENAVASFDGDTNIPMRTGDRIVIERAGKNTKIVKTNHISFLEILRKKMNNS
ncbi:MAG: NAD(+)/NADH kinase [Lachnospiraceae bacterium]|nr:NAD(+)/NADH kinase [Lachnospiraceae bacterium]MDD3615154.1 NAD(+)/NADH kinase [Lachnospiraceae bacterium]